MTGSSIKLTETRASYKPLAPTQLTLLLIKKEGAEDIVQQVSRNLRTKTNQIADWIRGLKSFEDLQADKNPH